MAQKTSKLKRALRKQLLREIGRGAAASPASATSKPSTSAPSRWHQAPAAKRELLERLDGFAHLRNKLHEVAEERGEWAGVPMPLDGERLVIEPRYPFAAGLMKANRPHETDGARVRNRWWSDVKRCTVVVIEEADGHITWGLVPGIHHLDHDLRTLGCSDAWGIEQESKALELLGSLVDHRKFKQYLLTGTFLERSKRSGITYMFRRLKPTVAIVAHGNATRILCTLCLHPVGYYEGSWAGALCASDDVIAHLQLMRADEHLYWRRANQHPSWVPQSGL